jgi:rhodanese-related sulfurtransferase
MRPLGVMLFGAILTLLLFLTASEEIAGSAKIPFPDIPRITKEELKSKLGDPAVIILDVRVENQWKESPNKILGAIHENATEVKSWAGKYRKDKTIVLYCA